MSNFLIRIIRNDNFRTLYSETIIYNISVSKGDLFKIKGFRTTIQNIRKFLICKIHNYKFRTSKIEIIGNHEQPIESVFKGDFFKFKDIKTTKGKLIIFEYNITYKDIRTLSIFFYLYNSQPQF